MSSAVPLEMNLGYIKKKKRQWLSKIEEVSLLAASLHGLYSSLVPASTSHLGLL